MYCAPRRVALAGEDACVTQYTNCYTLAYVTPSLSFIRLSQDIMCSRYYYALITDEQIMSRNDVLCIVCIM